MDEVKLRDLSAIQVYAIEEFEWAKATVAKTVEACVQCEDKIKQYDNVILDLEKNKALYKEDRKVGRIVNYLQCARNFLYKQVRKFTAFETALKEKRDVLEKKRKENALLLETSKAGKMEERKVAQESRNAPVQSVLNMERKRGNPNFVKGKPSPYAKGGKNGKKVK